MSAAFVFWPYQNRSWIENGLSLSIIYIVFACLRHWAAEILFEGNLPLFGQTLSIGLLGRSDHLGKVFWVKTTPGPSYGHLVVTIDHYLYRASVFYFNKIET